VIWVFIYVVQDSTAGDHVINNVTFRYLLESELARNRQVLSIIIPETVIGNKRNRCDTSANKEIVTLQ